MKTLIGIALVSAAVALSAGPMPSGFVIWKNEQLQAFDKSLAPKMDKGKVATQNLARFSNHLVMVAHREGPGQAEYHEKQTDVFIVECGTARLVVGGKMVNAKTTAPNEQRADSIQGGETETIAAGDIIHIPARIPHQVLVQPGQKFTYAVVKIDEK